MQRAVLRVTSLAVARLAPHVPPLIVALASAVARRNIICFLIILVAPSICDREWLREAASKVWLLGLPVRCGWRYGIHSVQMAALKFVSYFVL